MSVDGSTTHTPDDEALLVMDDTYDSLLEALKNVISKIIGVAGIVKLKHPVEDYLNRCLEQMLNDISFNLLQDSNKPQFTSSMGLPVSCRPESTAEGSRKASARCNKRKNLHEPTGSRPDTGPRDPKVLASESNNNTQIKAAKMSRTSEFTSFSCPYRKRNPKRFNVRDLKRNCATTPLSSLPLLK